MNGKSAFLTFVFGIGILMLLELSREHAIGVGVFITIVGGDGG